MDGYIYIYSYRLNREYVSLHVFILELQKENFCLIKQDLSKFFNIRLSNTSTSNTLSISVIHSHKLIDFDDLELNSDKC